MMITRCKTIVCLFAIVATSMFGGALAPDVVPEMTRQASAAFILQEDFGDGSATDGTPKTWRPYAEFGYGNGTVDAASGDLVLTPPVNEILAVIAEPEDDVSDASYRMRVRLAGQVSTDAHGTGMLVNGDYETGSIIDAGIRTDGGVYLGYHLHAVDYNGLDFVPTDLRPVEEDVVIQLDSFEGELSLFAWRAGDDMPASPLIQVNAPFSQSGSMGLYTNPPPGGGSATFRYLHVADTPIVPEPGSRTLCAIGSGIVVSGLLFGRRIRRPRFAR